MLHDEFRIRLKFVEKDLTQLESAKDEAELYLKQRDKVALCKFKLYHKYLFDIKKDRSGADGNLETLKANIGKIEEKSEEVHQYMTSVFCILFIICL